MDNEISARELSILQAAAKVFSQKGFKGATTREIAQEAGIAEGTIFRYFKTKKDILHHIMIRLIETVLTDMIIPSLEEAYSQSREKTPEEAFYSVLENRIKLIDNNFDLFKVVLTEVQYDSNLRRIYIENIFLPVKRIIGQFIQDGINSGVFREIDVDLVSRYFMSMFITFIMERRLLNNDAALNWDIEIKNMTDIIFYGIRRRDAQ